MTRKRKTVDDYHALASQRGFKWRGTSALYTRQKTLWECVLGHQWEATHGNIRSGYGCPYCAGNARKTANDYHVLAGARGFKWLGSMIPSNVCTKTLWECSMGHQWETAYHTIKGSKTGCPYCAGNVRKIPADYHALAEKRGFKWIGPAVSNVGTKTTWECEHGHHWQAAYDYIRGGARLPVVCKSNSKDS